MSSLIKNKSNNCCICYKENLYWSPNPKKSQVEVFICKHFVCKDCYKNFNRESFSCPVCRSTGQLYRNSLSSKEINRWNTISEWYYHWEDYMSWNKEGLKRSSFGKIYFQLIDKIEEYLVNKKNEKLKRNKVRIKLKEAQRKKEEKQISICDLCKTKCTSLKQLSIHYKSKNCYKRAKKLI